MDTIIDNTEPKSGELKFINYKGKKIFYQNFTNCSLEQSHKGLAEGRKLFSSQPLGSVLSLLDVSGADFDITLVDDLKKYANDNKPYVKRSVVVGIEGLKKVVLQGVIAFTGRNFELFDDVKSAREALVKD